jgi:hypothetical protein
VIREEVVMRQSNGVTASRREPPRGRNKRNRYSEQVDEAAKELESEPVEVERELPAEENSPVEQTEPHSRPASPLFED